MKKFFQVLIPLVLVIVIIASAIWYLFVYDRPMLESLMLHQARRFVQEGNYSAAAWCYNQAYDHSDQNKSIPIELANVYKSHGNYTKAEATISQAISDGATAELYIALSQLYVEQDKLLDAVTMLDQITDPQIKAEIDKLQPAAPVVVPDPGFYHEYITVALLSEGGTLYASCDGEYPSISKDKFTQPFALNGGETTIYALSVAENGLVSPVTIAGYTVVGVIEDVTLSDPSVDAMIRAQLSLGRETVIQTSDLWKIEEMIFPEDATHYEDLAKFPYLRSLTIDNGRFTDLSFLSGAQYLEKLRITGCALSQDDLSVIASLPALKELVLADCDLSNITPLGNARGLTSLNLSSNAIKNLDPLAGLTDLEYLNLQHNAVTSVTAVSVLPNLTELDVSYNSISSISALATCVNLERLNAAYNQLTGINGVDNLVHLCTLNVANNNIEDISVLAACLELEDLDVSHNLISSIEALSPLVLLKNFNFSYNTVSALPQWPTECALVSIDGAYNLLDNIDVLADMPNLNYVFMDYNEAISDISKLANCYNLVRVDVYGTAVRDVSALTEDHDIIVNFTPYTVDG